MCKPYVYSSRVCQKEGTVRDSNDDVRIGPPIPLSSLGSTEF